MKVAGHVTVVSLLLAALSQPVNANDDRYRTELIGSMMLRSEVGAQVPLDSPGGTLRFDFGRHLGANFWFLASLAWARINGGSAQDCSECIEAQTSDSMIGGLGFRYVFPVTEMEIFVQAGVGYLLDIVDQSGDGARPPMGFNNQVAFLGSFGAGYGLTDYLTVGIRFDTLLGADLDAINIGCYTGMNF
ncbi:MAG: hypothetical protein JRJ19_14820 [Deltaproteobacteria bacterium]|nr:hypothetical protein [Deltaproteobacteria bacterium]MBW1873340.1 hypothetical protein [Deltaproteobacteria bacterium]